VQRRTPNRRSAYWPVLGYFMLSSVKPNVGKLAEKASTSQRSAVTPCAQHEAPRVLTADTRARLRAAHRRLRRVKGGREVRELLARHLLVELDRKLHAAVHKVCDCLARPTGVAVPHEFYNNTPRDTPRGNLPLIRSNVSDLRLHVPI